MKAHIYFMFFLFTSIVYGQTVGPRFGGEIAFYSSVFYPKQFENVTTPIHYDKRRYVSEVYDITYSKINFSLGVSLGFNVNWINRDRWRITQHFSLGWGKYSGNTELRLKSHGDSLKTNLPYTTSEVSIGYQSSAQIEGYEYYLSSDLLLFRKFEKNWALGVGGGFHQFSRVWLAYRGMSTSGYVPTFGPRSTSVVSDCFSPAIHLRAEKNWAFISVFINYSQAIHLTKSKFNYVETKGKSQPVPGSLNEPSRLPGRLLIGCRFNWGY